MLLVLKNNLFVYILIHCSQLIQTEVETFMYRRSNNVLVVVVVVEVDVNVETRKNNNKHSLVGAECCFCY